MKILSILIPLLLFGTVAFADPLEDSNRLFDWAEATYPEYFSPSRASTQSIQPYLARYYPMTQNYLGTLGDEVYVYGDIFGGLLQVGYISDFISLDSTNGDNSNNSGSSTSNWYQPGTDVSWQWQLSGSVNESYSVDIYDIDLFLADKTLIQRLQSGGKKVICYFSAGSYEDFREDIDLFKQEELGETLDGWEDERWLDIRSANVRSIMQLRLDLAQSKGCDGVEPDNMDAYQNDSGFNLTAEDQLSYNRFIAEQAHQRQLSVGLKNDLAQIEQLVDDFDFAVNEQCYEFNECEYLLPFIRQGKAVLNVEYSEQYLNNSDAFKQLCQTSQQNQIYSLILPLELDDSFRVSCK